MRTIDIREFRNLNINAGLDSYLGWYFNPDNSVVLFERGDDEYYEKLCEAAKGVIDKPSAFDVLGELDGLDVPTRDIERLDEGDQGLEEEEVNSFGDDLEQDNEDFGPVTDVNEVLTEREFNLNNWKTETLEKLNTKTINLAAVKKILKEIVERL